ncbi:hypothetical protein B0T21DRAFT_16400 [Apiosordaria backusii]|uniref:Uncharacterized protein n=1 Tax=Apiosordaria backusii TaxID=314023 RepID=A0AA40EYX3_9PEZI|nr:hypothetical protein B0T21DRAFT_16400 [Apiosordaria backusii]
MIPTSIFLPLYFLTCRLKTFFYLHFSSTILFLFCSIALGGTRKSRYSLSYFHFHASHPL